MFTKDPFEKAILTTDEEHNEAVVDYLKKNKFLLIGGILAIIIGSSLWSWHKERQYNIAALASYQYQQLIENQNFDKNLALAIMHDYKNTPYALFSALVLSDFYAKQHNYSQSINTLEQAKKMNKNHGINEIIMLRLARMQLNNHQPDLAIQTLNGLKNKMYLSNKFDMQGDAYLQQHDPKRAIFAYKQAMGYLPGKASNPMYSILSIKISQAKI